MSGSFRGFEMKGFEALNHNDFGPAESKLSTLFTELRIRLEEDTGREWFNWGPKTNKRAHACWACLWSGREEKAEFEPQLNIIVYPDEIRVRLAYVVESRLYPHLPVPECTKHFLKTDTKIMDDVAKDKNLEFVAWRLRKPIAPTPSQKFRHLQKAARRALGGWFRLGKKGELLCNALEMGRKYNPSCVVEMKEGFADEAYCIFAHVYERLKDELWA